MPVQQRHGFRTHIRVVREDGREFPNMFVAYRELLGTREELGYSEHQRMRAAIRAGQQPRDSHGFTWRQVGVAAAVAGALAAAETASIRWTDFTFGVEIECLAPFAQHIMKGVLDQAGFSSWRVVNDGSLNGAPGFFPMEVVSPVLRGEEGLTTLRNVMALLQAKGCKVNKSCGMHVHVGVRGMAPAQVRKIAAAFLNAEHCFDALVPPARRDGNRYCQSNHTLVRHGGNASRLSSASSISMIANIINGGTSPQHYNPYRYYKLNFQSFVHHGTIEFRQHGGTVEAEKAANWVRLITGFCANAAEKPEQTFGQRVELNQFLDECCDEVAARYMRTRAAKFAAAGVRRAA